MMKRLLLLLLCLLLPLGSGAQTITPGPVVGNGNWVAQNITTGTTYVPAAGVTEIQVIMVGGGSGGGGCAATTAAASGGSYAAFVNALIAVTPGVGITYGVGALGTGGAAGNNNGNAGTDTTFAALTAKAALPGIGSATGNAAVPNALVLASLIQVTAPGTGYTLQPVPLPVNGSAGATSTGGTGGRGAWGNAGTGGTSAVGNNASGFGSSGGGAGCSSGAFKGGDGVPGLIVVIAPALGTFS